MKFTASADREKLLKRILPSLAIGVLYFVFLAPRIHTSTNKVAAEVLRLRDSGATEEAIFQIEQQKQTLLQEITQLQRTSQQSGGTVAGHIPFLSQPDYANRVVKRLTTTLAQNHVRIIEENEQELTALREGLPRSIREISESLAPHTSRPASLWSVHCSGAYPNIYQTLASLTQDEPAVIPIALDLIQPEGNGDLEWTITIWK
jgi:hypothetical protein